jgi:hypothetical protein
MEGNYFKNGGLRSLNLGGSTGLQFFRPDTAHFEAADLQVYSNVFIGSWAAIAYVGSVNVQVVNNTIYQPENWVIRILQETVDSTRFLECGDNTFRNNIIYLGDGISTETNIGPNTRPQTFTISNNLWYNYENPGWLGPFLPVTDSNNIIGDDPLFINPGLDDFSLNNSSPAINAGYPVSDPSLDFVDATFNTPPSIGAYEGNPLTSISSTISDKTQFALSIFPNPSAQVLFIQYELIEKQSVEISIIDVTGVERVLFSAAMQSCGTHLKRFNIATIPNGAYILKLVAGYSISTKKVLINR